MMMLVTFIIHAMWSVNWCTETLIIVIIIVACIIIIVIVIAVSIVAVR